MALGTFAVVAACGNDHPRSAELTVGNPAARGGGFGFDFSDAGSTSPPGCGVLDDGTACECVDAALFVDPPTIYFALDSSGSMAIDDRWTQTRLTVADVMRSVGPRANFGAMAFPAGNGGQCSPGVEVLAITPGDPPSATDGPAVQRMIAATGYIPGGGTPTAAALKLVNQRLQNVSGKAYVILATDGAPNCNDLAACGISQCQLNIEHYQDENHDCAPGGPENCCTNSGGNCNDGVATLDAIRALKARNIPVYVIGLPGTQFPAYAELLNDMADAGGTAQAGATRYFAVQSGTSAEILVALKKIAAQITGTCQFDLKEAPADPKLVNVYFDNLILPQESVNGWKIEGKTVTLLGRACDRVKTGDVLDVRIIAGCPTVYPK